MTTPPKVTVLIPVYNRVQYIGAAIESILAQSFSNFELLLIDDGSTDDSVTCIQSYTDPRIRLLRNGRNLGIPRTRNLGVTSARGEYIAMLDSDDLAVPRRLERQVTFLDRHRDYALVGSWATVMREKPHRSPHKIGILPVSADDVRARFLFHCSLTQSSVTGRTAILQEQRYREDFEVCSDFELWVRIVKHHKVANLPEFLVQRRLHSARVTSTRGQLVRQRKLAIFRTQLTELGVPFTESDLVRHFFLLRMAHNPVAVTEEYLDWADTWLRTLQETNGSSARYPQDIFTQVLSEMWFAVCWQAARRIGRRAWWRFWRAPLRHYLWASLSKYLWLWTTQRFPHSERGYLPPALPLSETK
ncbi:MAG: glycosyltransferase family 2 protein [Candidatus Binatia bacterium]